MAPPLTQDVDGLVIGVDIGGTKVLAGLVDRAGAVVARDQRPTPREDTESALERIGAQLADLLAAAPAPVRAIGLGVPSTIDRGPGVAVASPNSPLVGVPIRD